MPYVPLAEKDTAKSSSGGYRSLSEGGVKPGATKNPSPPSEEGSDTVIKPTFQPGGGFKSSPGPNSIFKTPNISTDVIGKGGVNYPAFPSGYGPSISKTDPYSDRPILQKEITPGAPTLLPDRVATTFDPTVPQKIDRSTFTNGRMPLAVSQQIRRSIGATAHDQLDHIMPLELGGSNDQASNLRKEATVKGVNTATDPLENKITQDARDGKISAEQAWREMGQLKGIQLLEDNTKPAERSGISWEDFGPNGKITNAVFNELGGQWVEHPVQSFKNLVDHADKATSGTVNNLIASAVQFKSDVLMDTNRTGAEKTAATLNLLHAIAQTTFFPVSETFAIASDLPVLKPAADAVGVIFNSAGKVVQFGADKLLDALPINQADKETLRGPIDKIASLAGQITLGGYIYGKVTGVMETKGEVTSKDVVDIAKEAETHAKDINAEAAKAPKGTMQDVTQGEGYKSIVDLRAAQEAAPGKPIEDIVPPAKTEVAAEAKPAEPASEPLTVPKIERSKVTKNTEIQKGDIISHPDIGKFIVSDVGTRVLPEGSVPTYSLKDIEGNIIQADHPDIVTFSKETKNGTQPIGEQAAAAPKPQLPDLGEPKAIREDLAAKPASSRSSVVLKPIKGTGETQTRSVAAGIEAQAVEKGLIEMKDLGDLPQYGEVNMKEQAQRAAELIANDPAKAIDVAMGRKAPPKDLIPEAVFTAVKLKAIAEGDVATLRDLAVESKLVSTATTMGQRIKALDDRVTDDPVRAIKEIIKAREEAQAAKLKSKDIVKAKEQVVKEIKAEIKKAAPARETWESFIEKIQC